MVSELTNTLCPKSPVLTLESVLEVRENSLNPTGKHELKEKGEVSQLEKQTDPTYVVKEKPQTQNRGRPKLYSTLNNPKVT